MTTATDPQAARLAAVNAKLDALRAEMRRADARHQEQLADIRARHHADMTEVTKRIRRLDDRIDIALMVTFGAIFFFAIVGVIISSIFRLI